MRYGQLYARAIPNPALIEETLKFINPERMIAATTAGTAKDPVKAKEARSANVQFINDKDILARWLATAQIINRDLDWNFDLDAIECIQYGEYNEDQYYGWHIDQHKVVYGDGRVRKCSFSVFLNDDYEGWEFDLELGGPNIEDRLKTFKKLPKNQMIFFQSEFWHRVRPVTKGVRKSLVGWVLGPKFRWKYQKSMKYIWQ